MKNIARVALIFLRSILSIIAVCGVLAAIAMWLPLEVLKPLISRFASDGHITTGAPYIHSVIGLLPTLYISFSLLLLSGTSYFLCRLAHNLSFFKTGRIFALNLIRFKHVIANEPILHLMAIVCIFVVAVVLRLNALDMSMRYDESTTFMEYAQMPIVVAITKYTAPNNHILHTALSHFSVSLFGEHPTSIRLPALLAGLGVVLATYFYGRILTNRNIALIGMAFSATNYYLVYFSVYARGYTMLTLFFLLLSLVVIRVTTSSWLGARQKAGIVLLSVAGLYTIPTASYGIAGNFINLAWLALKKPWPEAMRRLTTVVFLGFVTAITCLFLYLAAFLHTPYKEWVKIPTFKSKMGSEGRIEKIKDNLEIFDTVIDDIAVVFPEWTSLFIGLMLTIGMVMAVAKFGLFRIHVFSLFAAVWIMLVVHSVAPFARVWVFLMPIACCVLAVPIVWPLSLITHHTVRHAACFATALLLVGSTAWAVLDTLETRHYLPDGDKIVRYFKDDFRKGDRLVALNHTVVPLGYYLYYLDVFQVRQRQEYPVTALVDHFRGIQTHPDMGLYEAAMDRYVYWLPSHADKLDSAERIFFVVDEKRDIEANVLAVNPSNFSPPEVVETFQRAKLYVSTRID